MSYIWEFVMDEPWKGFSEREIVLEATRNIYIVIL